MSSFNFQLEVTLCFSRYRMLLRLLLWICLLSGVVAERDLPTDLDDPIIGSEKGALQIVVTTECWTTYFIYQTLVLNYTFNRVSQPGKLTRVLSCNEDNLETRMSKEDLEMMDTLVVPQWTEHPKTKDYYQPYNRPVALNFWLAERKPTAEWTLVLDPDMMFRQPFYPEYFNLPEGFASASQYNYLIGGKNQLADTHIPEVPTLDDLNGGAKGRRADEAGAYYFMRTRDLVKIAPLWLKYTEDIRMDENAWMYVGDSNLKPHEKPWISEMYGYVFAAAKAGIRHKVESTVQYYPSYDVKDIPILTHYGLDHRILDYQFDKHLHFDFESFMCPPWNMSSTRGKEEDGGLFPHPPHPSELKTHEPRKLYGELTSIDFVNNINKALCERHRSVCEDSDQLKTECGIVDEIQEEVEKALKPLHLPGVLCHDDNEHCSFWLTRNECVESWMYMTENCRASCQLCRPYVSLEEAKKRLEANTTMVPTTVENPQQEDTAKEEPTKEMNMMKEVTQLLIQRCSRLGMKEFREDPICIRLMNEGYMNLEAVELTKLQVTHVGPNKYQPLVDYGSYLIWVAVVLTVLMVIVKLSSRRKQKRHNSRYRN